MKALCEAVRIYGPLAGRILLALLYVMAFGTGPLSLDNRQRP